MASSSKNPPNHQDPKTSAFMASNNNEPTTQKRQLTINIPNPVNSSAVLELIADGKIEEKIRKFSLVGKVITNREARLSAIKKIAFEGWHLKGKVEIHFLQKNMFLFVFKTEEESERMLNNQPWSVLDKHIVFKIWEDGMDFNNIDFSLLPIWVQVKNIPLSLRSVPNAIQIAGMFPQVEKYGFSRESDVIWKDTVRFKACIKVDDKIPTDFQFPLNGKQVDIEFKYERLADLCYDCGHISHRYKDCDSKDAEGNIGKYGPWLRAEYKGRLKPGSILGINRDKEEEVDGQKDEDGGKSVNDPLDHPLVGFKAVATGLAIPNIEVLADPSQIEALLAQNGGININEMGKTSDISTPARKKAKLSGNFENERAICEKILGWAPGDLFFKKMKLDAVIHLFGQQIFGPMNYEDPSPAGLDNTELGFKKPTENYIKWASKYRPILAAEIEDDCQVKEKSPGNFTIVDKNGLELPLDIEFAPNIIPAKESSFMETWEKELNASGSVERNLKRIRKAAAAKMKAEAKKATMQKVMKVLSDPVECLEQNTNLNLLEVQNQDKGMGSCSNTDGLMVVAEMSKDDNMEEGLPAKGKEVGKMKMKDGAFGSNADDAV